jgi:hypothetical protein
MAVVLLLISPVVSSRRLLPRARYVVPALSWPVLAAAPAFGYLFIGPDLEGSRYVYLPMAGWVILLVITTQSIVTLRRWLLPIVGFCAIAGAALMVAQTRSLLENWSAAAVHRDALLVQAVGVADVHACQTAHFSGAPKQYNGAQLFRNGLDQAVMAARSNEAGRTQARCEFTWDGRQFRER